MTPEQIPQPVQDQILAEAKRRYMPDDIRFDQFIEDAQWGYCLHQDPFILTPERTKKPQN